MCTPIGSKFSIEQMTTQLSARSRITSSSNSFHPAIDFSIRISEIGLASSPRAASVRNSSAGGGDAGAAPTEDERGPDHHRQTDLLDHLQRLVEVVRDAPTPA